MWKIVIKMPSIQTSSLRFHLQTPFNKAQPAAVPAPAPVVEMGSVNKVDPEKTKQLTQAVVEQVRSLASTNTRLRKMNIVIKC